MRTIDVWTVVRFAHLVAVTMWVGAQAVLTLVVMPVLRRNEVAQEVTDRLVRRFAAVSMFGAMPAALASGFALVWHRGMSQNAFSIEGWGTTLSVKLILVLVTIGTAIAHGLAAGYGIERTGRVLVIASLVLSLILVLLGASLAG